MSIDHRHLDLDHHPHELNEEHFRYWNDDDTDDDDRKVSMFHWNLNDDTQSITMNSSVNEDADSTLFLMHESLMLMLMLISEVKGRLTIEMIVIEHEEILVDHRLNPVRLGILDLDLLIHKQEHCSSNNFPMVNDTHDSFDQLRSIAMENNNYSSWN